MAFNIINILKKRVGDVEKELNQAERNLSLISKKVYELEGLDKIDLLKEELKKEIDNLRFHSNREGYNEFYGKWPYERERGERKIIQKKIDEYIGELCQLAKSKLI